MRSKIWGLGVVCALPLVLYNNCGEFASKTIEHVIVNSADSGGHHDDDSDFSGSEKLHGVLLPVDQPYTCNFSESGSTNSHIRRLSGLELKNSLSHLFGSSVMNSSVVKPTLALLPTEENVDIVEGWDNSLKDVAGLLEVGKAIGDYVFSSNTRIETLLPGCSTNPVGADCRNSFATFAKRAFRRPLSSSELGSFENFVNGYSDKKEGRKYAVIRALMSPFFHQHMEVDEVAASADRVKLNQYEVASRLSFRLTGYPPDDQLLQAADQGRLSSLDELKVQAERLVNTDRAKQHFVNFLVYWLRIETRADPSPMMQTALGINPNGFTQEMYKEFEDWVDYVVFQNNGTFQDLLLEQVMFPSTPRLAQLLASSQSGGPVNAPSHRGGLLFRPVVMNIGQSNSNPIARGVLLRKRFLCTNLPSPDSTVVNSRLNDLNELSPTEFSSREIVTHVTSAPRCMACHTHINSIGFAFESFGPFGEYRTTEKVFNTNGALIAEHLIDTHVSSVPIPGRAPVSVDSAEDLMRELASTPAVMRCYSQQLFRFTRVREASAKDGCSLNTATDILTAGGSIKDSIVNSVVNENIFWRKAAE